MQLYQKNNMSLAFAETPIQKKYPNTQSMVYSPTFALFFMVNLGKYTDIPYTLSVWDIFFSREKIPTPKPVAVVLFLRKGFELGQLCRRELPSFGKGPKRVSI